MSVARTQMHVHQSECLAVAGLELSSVPRSDWTMAEITTLFELPFNDLLYGAQWVHRQIFDPNAVQISTLLS
ncbi:MAG: biotin synthase-like enzyme, partial [Gammaproteobacteria bacterium]